MSLQGDLLQAANDLRQMERQNANLQKEAAQFRKLGSVTQALQVLIDQGQINQPQEVLDKLGELLNQSDEDLKVLTKAAQMSRPAFAEMAVAVDKSDGESGVDATGRFHAALLR